MLSHKRNSQVLWEKQALVFFLPCFFLLTFLPYCETSVFFQNMFFDCFQRPIAKKTRVLPTRRLLLSVAPCSQPQEGYGHGMVCRRRVEPNEVLLALPLEVCWTVPWSGALRPVGGWQPWRPRTSKEDGKNI